MNFDVCFCSSCSGKMAKVAFKVSQGSAAYVRCGGKHDKGFIAKFIAEFKSECTLKIAQHTPKLHTNVAWHAFN